MTTQNSTPNQQTHAITIQRVFDAPVGRVWRAWTDPEQLKRWWGTRAITTQVAEFDFRLGGKYLYCMRGPDMPDTWGTGIFNEIVDQQRIVFSDSFADPQGNPVSGAYYGMGNEFPEDLQISVTLEDLGSGHTRQTMQHIGMPPGELSDMTTASWNESFDRLAELLAAG